MFCHDASSIQIPNRSCWLRWGKSLVFSFSIVLSKRDAEFGYKATKEEVHPNPVGNGRSTIEFFRDSFAMTGREVVALMGAHTFGKPHFKVSMFPYTWTSKATNLWTNDYYKAITGRPRWIFLCLSLFFIFLFTFRWFFSPAPGDTCNKVGDAFGNIPK